MIREFPLYIQLQNATLSIAFGSILNLLRHLIREKLSLSLFGHPWREFDYNPVVEFLASVPSVYKLHTVWAKNLARKAFDEKLTKNICWRRDKVGWPIPEECWLHGKLRENFVRTIINSRYLLYWYSGLNGKKIFQRYSFELLEVSKDGTLPFVCTEKSFAI